ncbi:hypothetical protein [Paraburkholderia caribensis]|uniref:hypothetical protein n=1 Tax=Paraburkholderia caribensis TaxID=75105 RepID=UPI0034D33E68
MNEPHARFVDRLESLGRALSTATVDGGGGGGDDGTMDHESRITELEKIVPTLATKADVAALPTKSDFADLRADFADFKAEMAGHKSGIADIRADIQKSITENTRWTHTALVAMIGAFLVGVTGLLFTIYNATKPGAPRSEPVSQPAAMTPQQPIIINIPPAPAAAQPPVQQK